MFCEHLTSVLAVFTSQLHHPIAWLPCPKPLHAFALPHFHSRLPPGNWIACTAHEQLLFFTADRCQAVAPRVALPQPPSQQQYSSTFPLQHGVGVSSYFHLLAYNCLKIICASSMLGYLICSLYCDQRMSSAGYFCSLLWVRWIE